MGAEVATAQDALEPGEVEGGSDGTTHVIVSDFFTIKYPR